MEPVTLRITGFDLSWLTLTGLFIIQVSFLPRKPTRFGKQINVKYTKKYSVNIVIVAFGERINRATIKLLRK